MHKCEKRSSWKYNFKIPKNIGILNLYVFIWTIRQGINITIVNEVIKTSTNKLHILKNDIYEASSNSEES